MKKVFFISALCLFTIVFMSFTSINNDDEVVTISVEEGGVFELDADLFNLSLETGEPIEIPIINSDEGSDHKIHVIICPGNGSPCMVEINQHGETNTLDARKSKNGPSTIVNHLDGPGKDVVTIHWK